MGFSLFIHGNRPVITLNRRKAVAGNGAALWQPLPQQAVNVALGRSGFGCRMRFRSYGSTAKYSWMSFINSSRPVRRPLFLIAAPTSARVSPISGKPTLPPVLLLLKPMNTSVPYYRKTSGKTRLRVWRWSQKPSGPTKKASGLAVTRRILPLFSRKPTVNSFRLSGSRLAPARNPYRYAQDGH